MKRKHLLAAEVFAYSFANYADHLPVGNNRFTRLMPHDAEILERAEVEGWPDAKLANSLDVAVEEVPDWRERFRRAKLVVDAPTPAASFRAGVRFSIEDALAEGLEREAFIERLVTQICYRAADLAYLLDMRGESLSDYSEELRREEDEESFEDA